MKEAKKTNLQIRGIPTDLHEKVRRQSEKRRQTMSEYVMELIQNDPDDMDMEKWLEQVRQWKPLAHGMSGAQAVRAARRIEEGLEP